MKAIILAAGMGTRLRPFTNDVPKPLTKIMGEPIIERQINYLKEKCINDIIVIVGYKKEQFYYLENKYNVKLIYNDKFNQGNTLYSMYMARDYLGDHYVLEGDDYLINNFIDPSIKRSAYFGAKKEWHSNEWLLFSDENNKVNKIVIGTDRNQYIMSGISFWSKEDSIKIKRLLEKYVQEDNWKSKIWDDVVIENLDEFDVKLIKLNDGDTFEIDNEYDLRMLVNKGYINFKF